MGKGFLEERKGGSKAKMTDISELLDNLQEAARTKGFIAETLMQKRSRVELVFEKEGKGNICIVINKEGDLCGYRLIEEREAVYSEFDAQSYDFSERRSNVPASVSVFKINNSSENFAAMRITGLEGVGSKGSEEDYYWGNIRMERWFGLSKLNEVLLERIRNDPVFAFNLLSNPNTAFPPADLAIDFPIVFPFEEYVPVGVNLLTDAQGIVYPFNTLPESFSRRAFLAGQPNGKVLASWDLKLRGGIEISYLSPEKTLDGTHVVRLVKPQGEALFLKVPIGLRASFVENIGAIMGSRTWYDDMPASNIPLITKITLDEQVEKR